MDEPVEAIAKIGDDAISYTTSKSFGLDDLFIVKDKNGVEGIGKWSDEVVKTGTIIPKSADEIKHLLKTDKNTSFFWSGSTNGVGGEARALEIAKSKGGTTLEGLLKERGIEMPAWTDNPQIWTDVSAEYAKQVSGEVRAVVGENLRIDNVWENVELPRLKSNTNVTKIITIDPETLVEFVIFIR